MKFKNTTFEFSHPLIPGSKDNHVEWEFEGNVEDIVAWNTQCGCTAKITVTGTKSGGKVSASYHEDDVKPDLKGINKNSKEYAEGKKNVNKYVDIYLNDGEDLFVKKGMRKVYNPDKEKVRLYIKGVVDFRSLKEFNEKQVSKGFRKKKV